MSDPGGATRTRLTTQHLLNEAFDAVNKQLKVYMEAGVTINPGDIQIGAVELKNHDTDDRQYVDPQHYAHVRSILRLWNGGTPADVDASHPVPVTVTDPALGFSGGLWHYALDAETIGLMSELASIDLRLEALREYQSGEVSSAFALDEDNTIYKRLDVLVKDGTPPSGYTSLFELLTYLSSINGNLQKDEGWTAWNGTDDALPADAIGLTMTAGGLIQHQIMVTNDEVSPSVRTIQYSFDGGSKWMTLKPGESRVVENVYFETWKLRSGDASGGEAYRAEAFTEA